MKAEHPPIMRHFGKRDDFVSEQAVETIRSAFQNQPDSLVYLYPDAGHGFATEKGKRCNEKAANLAGQRSLDFIERVLS